MTPPAPTRSGPRFRFQPSGVHSDWTRLHAGDREPLPTDPQLLEAWTLFHNGHFLDAAAEGIRIGGVAGWNLANKAMAVHANYLEERERDRLDQFMQVAERAQHCIAQAPEHPNGWYWQAYALGRYSQGISVAKALAQGIGSKVKLALEKAIALDPLHADAHIALGSFHAEVIDKVGVLIGGMTYGARKDTGLAHFRKALELAPGSAIALIEYANGLVMLEGDSSLPEATRLYEQAAACPPLDAHGLLDVELARAELAG